jgi:hypothetical protein
MKDKIFEEDVLRSFAYSELEDAWRTDSTEVDGERTYAVSRVSKALNDMGFPRHLIDAASTLAAIKVNEELNAEKTR